MALTTVTTMPSVLTMLGALLALVCLAILGQESNAVSVTLWRQAQHVPELPLQTALMDRCG